MKGMWPTPLHSTAVRQLRTDGSGPMFRQGRDVVVLHLRHLVVHLPRKEYTYQRTDSKQRATGITTEMRDECTHTQGYSQCNHDQEQHTKEARHTYLQVSQAHHAPDPMHRLQPLTSAAYGGGVGVWNRA